MTKKLSLLQDCCSPLWGWLSSPMSTQYWPQTTPYIQVILNANSVYSDKSYLSLQLKVSTDSLWICLKYNWNFKYYSWKMNHIYIHIYVYTYIYEVNFQKEPFSKSKKITRYYMVWYFSIYRLIILNCQWNWIITWIFFS